MYDKLLQVGAAHVAGKAMRDEMQVDLEKLPASTVVTQELRQREEGMQAHGGNAVALSAALPLEYEHQRKWLLENNKMLRESLKLKSQQRRGERDKVWMNVKMVSVPVDVKNKGCIASESLQNQEAHNSENCIQSGKNCGEQDSALARVMRSRIDGHQEVGICACTLT